MVLETGAHTMTRKVKLKNVGLTPQKEEPKIS
jgi:hypothetical protein